jgi:hypothetical protein
MQMKHLRAILAVTLLAAVACSGQKEEAPSARPANAKRVDDSKAGHVAGRVTIAGVPANLRSRWKPINCARTQRGTVREFRRR